MNNDKVMLVMGIVDYACQELGREMFEEDIEEVTSKIVSVMDIMSEEEIETLAFDLVSEFPFM